MTIFVKLAEPQTHQVALWERHPDHPGGEVFLAGDGTFEVAATAAVETRLRNGRLVLVEHAITSAPGESEPVAAAVIEAEPATTEEQPTPAGPKKSAPARKRGGL